MEDAIKADRIKERDRLRVYRELRLWVDNLTARWHEIIKHYSRLYLTIESDLLPAIAGLAREAEGCRTGSYLAGLWEDSLIEDLLWRVDQLGTGQSERRPALYRAPTWPWASVNAGVSYHAGRVGYRSSIRILEAIYTPIAGADSFGEISEAHLIVEGKLGRAELLYTTLDEGHVDPRVYNLKMADKVLTLHADYHLCLEGANHVKDHEELLHLRVYRDIHLAIALVLRQLGLSKSTYERVEIVEWPTLIEAGFFDIEFLKVVCYPLELDSSKITIL